MKVPLLDLKTQYKAIKDEIKPVLEEVCDSQYFILGPQVQELEKSIADYCGTSHAVGVSSGTDALLIALMAMEVGPGDAVITTPYTFFATVGSIVRVGATPVFVDIDPETFNIDPELCRQRLEAMPEGLTAKVLMPVHLYGQSADMDPLTELAKEFKLNVIEDAAQAIGTEYLSASAIRKTGSMGDAGCFSFFPSKNLGCFGDGGMVTTNNEEIAHRITMLRNHGSEPKYYHKIIGGNFRLDAIQAAVLNIKLKHLDNWHAARRENAAFYDKAFADSPVSSPAAVYRDSGTTNFHIYNQYVVRIPNRDKIWETMKNADIGCEVYYPIPLHVQDCFASLGYKQGDFPQSEKAAAETLALPIYPEMTTEMQEYVADTLLKSV